jgi:hypothetical protein
LAVAYGEYWQYANCIHNFVRGVDERVLSKTHVCDDRFAPFLFLAAFLLARGVPPLETSSTRQLAVNAGIFSEKGKRYQYAADRLERCGLPKDAENLKGMVKIENYAYKLNAKNPYDHSECKDRARIPRIVWFAAWEWFVHASVYMLSFEHWFLNVDFSVFGLPPGGPSGRVIGKGLSHKARADLLAQKMARFKRPVVFSMDGSKWDRQVNEVQLVAAAIVVAAAFSSTTLADILLRQVGRKAKVRFGDYIVLVTILAGRFSGDLDTGFGNCLIFLIVLVATLFDFETQSWKVEFDTAIDGDDALGICEEEDFERMRTLIIRGFYLAGHDLTDEGATTEFEGIVWCQCHPVLVSSGNHVMVRDPRVAISKAYSSTKYASSAQAAMDHLYMVALGEYILGIGVPVMQEWAYNTMQNCLKAGAKPFRLKQDNSSTYRRLRDYLLEVGLFETLPPNSVVLKHWRDYRAIHSSIVDLYSKEAITQEARLSLERAFGISLHEQLLLESCSVEINFEFGEQPLNLFD